VNTIPALEIKRRGISIIDEQIEFGPVHVIKNNRPQRMQGSGLVWRILVKRM